jgi:hypothetical protein
MLVVVGLVRRRGALARDQMLAIGLGLVVGIGAVVVRRVRSFAPS